MLNQIHAHALLDNSFAFETTLSGRGYARHIPLWQAQDYRVTLLFLKLPTPEAAIRRVAKRVAQGGHLVSESVIRRRFHAGWHNFNHLYRGLVDEWSLYDNSTYNPKLLAEGRK